MKALLTGHGNFATGLKNAFEFIAGPQEDLEILPFLESSNLSNFQKELETFAQAQADEERIIFTDLRGGTPFNYSMLAKGINDKIHVLSGCNLPMLLEFMSSTLTGLDNPEIIKNVLKAAQEGISEGLLVVQSQSVEDGGI